MPGDQLDRDDLIRGINAVIAKLRAAGEPAGIRIVGGAALALRGILIGAPPLMSMRTSVGTKI